MNWKTPILLNAHLTILENHSFSCVLNFAKSADPYFTSYFRDFREFKGFKILRKYRIYFRVFCYIAETKISENKVVIDTDLFCYLHSEFLFPWKQRMHCSLTIWLAQWTSAHNEAICVNNFFPSCVMPRIWGLLDALNKQRRFTPNT